MPAGRPKKFTSAEEMQRVIDLYFHALYVERSHDEESLGDLPEEDVMFINQLRREIYLTVPTVTGLAYALDMSTESLRKYEGNPEFVATVKRAKARIENFLETCLIGSNVTGTIFNLKNNYGWKDRTEVSQEVDMKVSSADKVSDDRLAAIATGGSTATPETPKS